jgi:hypothetical protein
LVACLVAQEIPGDLVGTAELRVAELLEEAAKGIEAMRQALDLFPKGCSAEVFYKSIRPYLAGWKNNPSLPHGLVYEVRDDPREGGGRKGDKAEDDWPLGAAGCAMGKKAAIFRRQRSSELPRR